MQPGLSYRESNVCEKTSKPSLDRRTLTQCDPFGSLNVTLDGCCDHRAIIPNEDLHRHAAEILSQADALLFGRATYEMMESAWWPRRGQKRGLIRWNPSPGRCTR